MAESVAGTDIPDLSWLAVGMAVYAGPTELPKYHDAFDAVGSEFASTPAPAWGVDIVRLPPM